MSPIHREGEVYYTAAEAARYIGISRDTFYRNVKAKLHPYHFGALRREYFRESDLDQLMEARSSSEEADEQ